MHSKQFIIFLFCLLLSNTSSAQISGVVFNEKNVALPGVTIFNKEHDTGTTTDDKGQFSMPFPDEHDITITISYVGYVTQTINIQYARNDVRLGKIIMKPDQKLLETIIIVDEGAKHSSTLSGQDVGENFFEQQNKGTFATTLEKLPGISAINVGVGIAKPVIRGLSSNRIIVNHYGIKQESQQWGADHGLEIDPFDAERVEIIKGPASIQYGSDGLGGVINVRPGSIPENGQLYGSLLTVYKTNNQHFGGSAKLAYSKNNFFFTGRASLQSFGDVGVPSASFDYNGFVLPIFNNKLKNTAGKENNITISGGYNHKNTLTRLTYSRYDFEGGLFAGAVGIPRSYTLQEDQNARNIETPKQDVSHQRLTLNHSIKNGENHFVMNLGYQINERKEFSRPEFHNIPPIGLDPNDHLAINLSLRTFSLNTHYELHSLSSKTNIGADIQWQDNIRSGFEFLLPDFNTLRSGVFVLKEWSVNDKLTINGGFRADVGKNNTTYSRQYIWNGNSQIIDSLVSDATYRTFFNWSASGGLSYKMYDQTYLKVNLARSFRIPHPAETSSNGIHHGTFRHEQGSAQLNSETGYQFDLSIQKTESKEFNYAVSAFFNYFHNYIYLGPTFPARFSTLPEAGQIFRYRQDDAIYTGGELEWDFAFAKFFKLQQTFEYVLSYNQTTGIALPFTPQPTFHTDLVLQISKKGNIVSTLSHVYYFAATSSWRKDRAEKPTPETHLWHFNLRSEIPFGKSMVTLDFQIQNVFNTYFLKHLSRYRWINVPEQGRNIVVSLKYAFGK